MSTHTESQAIQLQAIQLRQQSVAAEKIAQERRAKVTQRLENPRRINEAAAYIVASPLVDSSFDGVIKTTVGPILARRAMKAIDKRDEIGREAKRHYEDNSPAYHQMALDEAAAQGVDVNFDGSVAVNIKPLEEPVPVPMSSGQKK